MLLAVIDQDGVVGERAEERLGIVLLGCLQERLNGRGKI